MAELAGLPESVLAHSRFFDHLVELIPARFYYTDEEPPAPLRYMKAQDREKERETRRALAKEAKRVKLDPERAKTTLELQREGGPRRPAREEEDSDEDGEREPAGTSGGADGSGGPKLAELRQRLHSKLEALRQERKESQRKEQVRQAQEFRRSSIGRQRKPPAQPQPGAKKRKQPEAPAAPQAAAAGGGDASLALSFGKLEFGDDGPTAFKKPRKQSKEQLLREAERKQQQRSELAKSADGQEKVQGEAWASALKKAKGEKVYDDPKLLRKSLKREQKQRGKSAAAWQERTKAQKAEQRDRQKKRRDNLASRAATKKAKKVERREKKLMRPGFEGRRDSFINGPKAAS